MPLKPNEVGARLVQACIALTPCDQGDDCFRWVAKDWGGVGTTCGYLISAAYWLVGVRGSVVNRSDTGTRYRPGANVSSIYNEGRPPFTHHKPGATYPPGTTIFLSEGPPKTEHLVMLESAEGMHWTIFQGGGQGPHGEAMRKKDLPYDGGKHLGGRTIVGVIYPQDLPVLAEETDVAHVLPESWFQRPIRDPYTGELAKGLELGASWADEENRPA